MNVKQFLSVYSDYGLIYGVNYSLLDYTSDVTLTIR